MTWEAVYRLCAVAGVPDPGPYQAWQLRALADQKMQLFWTAVGTISFAAAGNFKGVKPDTFNLYARDRMRRVASDLRKVRSEADLPDNLPESEFESRWQEHINGSG